MNRPAFDVGMQGIEDSWLNNDLQGCVLGAEIMERNLLKM